ncbi:MAG: hypothetical protein GF401_12270 [Chitinivibrionales bacterium]|nr:hypothetical protein [Chitinivibrionales bacterium]
MRKFTIHSLLIALMITSLWQIPVSGQTEEAYDEYTGEEMESNRLSGPRMGITYVLPGTMQDRLTDKGIDPVISQFGWHFEWVVAPRSGGPGFVIQAIPFLGGVEYGTVIPSTSLAMGIRMPMGLEFGMGPQIYYTGERNNPVGTSLLIAVGQSLNFRGVNIPLNLGLLTNDEGQRISFVFGYAIKNKKKRTIHY